MLIILSVLKPTKMIKLEKCLPTKSIFDFLWLKNILFSSLLWYNIFENQSNTILNLHEYFVDYFLNFDIIKLQKYFLIFFGGQNMSIGSTIKRLRREKNITQEQLAEYLGITSRAISQWECDRTAPDISQIPALCHIFDISSDVLLGIDIEKNNEKIKKYLTEAVELGNQGKLSERT